MENSIKDQSTLPECNIFELETQKKLANLHSRYFSEPEENELSFHNQLKHLESCLMLERKIINFEDSFII
ncbi:hypothetical protein [Marinomonas sp. 2405UD68-3]|uniref:hypothetical protein n=1 Tax=Marinomonas sp. 2405UD68-3 TaxID=3391835 RepID=UPI0039C984D7